MQGKKVFVDQYKYVGMRKRLAKDLRGKGQFPETLIQAIAKIPRHFFLDSAFAEQAYEDKAFPIGSGQTISQPFTVLYQTNLLDVRPGDNILEIGTGSGYQAAILAEIGAQVFTIERVEELQKRAREVLKVLGYKVKLFVGDGTLGVSKHAPYDKILVTAAAPNAPQSLLEQLSIGGLLVIPVGNKEVQQMLRIKRMSENEYFTETFETFRFVPLIGQRGW
ncbi:MAG: protein-L-isoaspartate(D-aspartate) O-methyltransferase [Bacteroidota bacterium]|nr:protein-L-isoaspartate(D-aspartate) O-methyltransferase [Bacteroidota bacterium]